MMQFDIHCTLGIPACTATKSETLQNHENRESVKNCMTVKSWYDHKKFFSWSSELCARKVWSNSSPCLPFNGRRTTEEAFAQLSHWRWVCPQLRSGRVLNRPRMPLAPWFCARSTASRCPWSRGRHCSLRQPSVTTLSKPLWRNDSCVLPPPPVVAESRPGWPSWLSPRPCTSTDSSPQLNILPRYCIYRQRLRLTAHPRSEPRSHLDHSCRVPLCRSKSAINL